LESSIENPGKPEIFLDGLPSSMKYIKISPDGLYLFVSISSGCEDCEPVDPLGTIMKVELNSPNNRFTVARGVKNSLGFAWGVNYPHNGTFWFTDTSKLNSKFPNELNNVKREDLHYGFPYCYGKNTFDPKYPNIRNCSSFESPIVELPPFVHPMGMSFCKQGVFPNEYSNSLFIAGNYISFFTLERGSDASESRKFGFRISRINLNDNSYERFICKFF
jgi:glucose/arabinose dehydrogenase